MGIIWQALARVRLKNVRGILTCGEGIELALQLATLLLRAHQPHPELLDRAERSLVLLRRAALPPLQCVQLLEQFLCLGLGRLRRGIGQLSLLRLRNTTTESQASLSLDCLGDRVGADQL